MPKDTDPTVISDLAGEPHSDSPQCASQVLTRITMNMNVLVAVVAGTEGDPHGEVSVSHGIDRVYFDVGKLLRITLTPDEARKAADALERGAVLAEMSGDIHAGDCEEDE